MHDVSATARTDAGRSSASGPPEAAPRDGAWFADGLRFQCTQCGGCCTGPPGYVWFTPEEGRAIAEHLGIAEDELLRRYAMRRRGKWSLGEVRVAKRQYDCVFLTRDDHGRAGCSIYPVRPQQCRTWPFWPSNLSSRRAWDHAARDCPGMNAGKLVPADQVRITAASNHTPL